MKFSVLVPVYQAERFLDACIQSVLCQTFTDFELILVDDGSKDRSGAICDAYAEKDARIRAFHKENGGQFSARSFALQHASGEIIVFLDADDALKENALERMEQTFAEYRCDCVFFGLDRVENGTVISSQVEPETVFLDNKREILRKFLLSSRYNSLCQKAVRADCVPKDEYDPKLDQVRHGEDLLQSLGIYRRIGTVVFLKDSLYLYTRNPDSVSVGGSYAKFAEDLFIVQARVYDFLIGAPDFTKDDLADYRRFCLNQFAGVLLMIAQAKESYPAKRACFERLQSDPFYRSILLSVPAPQSNKGRLITLFRARRYRGLILETRLYKLFFARK